MNVKEIEKELREDLQAAPAQKVVYLEGKTDLTPFFGLLGVKTPADNLHQGVLVKGLRTEEKARSSGGTAVKMRVEVASQQNYPGIYGLIDGDGGSLGTLAAHFDPPYSGSLFFWKAYCIENLLVKTGWPVAWGDAPDWPVELKNYGPYVALNRVSREIQTHLEVLDLARFLKPRLNTPLKTAAEVSAALAQDKYRIQNFDAEDLFQNELTAFEKAIDTGLDEAHTLLNGKWLVEHLACSRTNRTPDKCRDEWSDHARSVGGLAEVRDLWMRITGTAP